jgi:nucleoside-diphosphate-sugar epimerase
MSRVLVTSTPAVVASRVILRFLATCHQVRAVVESPTRVAEVRAMLEHPRVSFIAADSDNDAGRLDAAAGCEFVDDRLRLRE